MSIRFGFAARLPVMIKYGALAQSFLEFVRNGVMAHSTTMQALRELWALEPQLVAGVKDLTTMNQLISRGCRTLLGWFRELRKGKVHFRNISATDQVLGA